MQNHSVPYWITREDKSIVYRATELEGFNTENKNGSDQKTCKCTFFS